MQALDWNTIGALATTALTAVLAYLGKRGLEELQALRLDFAAMTVRESHRDATLVRHGEKLDEHTQLHTEHRVQFNEYGMRIRALEDDE